MMKPKSKWALTIGPPAEGPIHEAAAAAPPAESRADPQRRRLSVSVVSKAPKPSREPTPYPRGARRAMDLRRPPRSSSGGVEPKIRQVGFVTPDASSAPSDAPAAAVASAAPQPSASSAGSPPASDLFPGSLSPVMIPPPRHADLLAPGTPSPAASASELGDDETWSRAPSAAELEANKGDLAEIQNDNVLASIPQKQKTSKAERRAIQEAQRAAKAAAREAGLSGKSAGTSSGANPAVPKQAKSSKASQKKDVPQAASTVASDKKVTERLPERDRKKDVPPPRMQFDDVHRVEKAKKRAIVNQYEARNRVELFRHLPQYVHGTQLPGLESKFFQLEPMHPSVYKVGLQYLSGGVSGDKVIVSHAITKVRDNDVLLTYGSSSVVEMILDYAHELGRKFRVIVIDSRPKLEGQGLLRRLVDKGINCTYTHINAISYIMHEVTRVFLGASSILSNGTLYSRVGTASVAMVAHAFGIPVLVCCEAYKFHERVQLDSICANELGDPDVILKVPGKTDPSHLKNLSDNENLQLLNLTYDATPSDYVSMIITDYGMLPPTSVPVIVREYRKEQLWI
ncbi:hypothetical protein GUJ93_ZPchr0013g34694 [Zizania palustris]|uniref:Translation initiation factor eIF-2B subunit delta n=1 Tax=Zizania palustris TaxID=103762 RepID=A0A8J5WV28_ZIZPA|nr:hypothetical protein GUJ93_ZPchr0013g34694 [Zizania palustris]